MYLTGRHGRRYGRKLCGNMSRKCFAAYNKYPTAAQRLIGSQGRMRPASAGKHVALLYMWL